VIALGFGLAIGAIVGAALAKLAANLMRRREAPLPQVPEEERDLIEINFAAHINHLREEVSNFAERLAGDDVLLRERLRDFEWGGHR
jgi:hypothetical protein